MDSPALVLASNLAIAILLTTIIALIIINEVIPLHYAYASRVIVIVSSITHTDASSHVS
jgi:hypothetical protein